MGKRFKNFKGSLICIESYNLLEIGSNNIFIFKDAYLNEKYIDSSVEEIKIDKCQN